MEFPLLPPLGALTSVDFALCVSHPGAQVTRAATSCQGSFTVTGTVESETNFKTPLVINEPQSPLN